MESELKNRHLLVYHELCNGNVLLYETLLLGQQGHIVLSLAWNNKERAFSSWMRIRRTSPNQQRRASARTSQKDMLSRIDVLTEYTYEIFLVKTRE